MSPSPTSSDVRPASRVSSSESTDDRDRTPPGPARRRVLAATAGAGVLGSVAGCASLDTTESNPESEPSNRTDTTETEPETDTDPSDAEDVDDLPLFDAHVHITPMAARGYDALSVDHLLDWMADNGVDYAAVLALESPEAYPVPISSPWLLEEVAEYDRLIPFCTIDPRTVSYGTDTVGDVLERYVDHGARGFGELKAGVDIDDEDARTLYELCADHDLPVLFHSDQRAMTDEIGLPGLEDVLGSYPDVDFVAHEHTWWIHVSGDVETMERGSAHEGPVASGGRVPELLAEYDNIYGDISAAAGWNALTRDEEFGQEFLETYHDQLVFGTDYLVPGGEIDHFDLFDRFDLDLDAWADIRYRNFDALLPRDGPVS